MSAIEAVMIYECHGGWLRFLLEYCIEGVLTCREIWQLVLAVVMLNKASACFGIVR